MGNNLSQNVGPSSVDSHLRPPGQGPRPATQPATASEEGGLPHLDDDEGLLGDEVDYNKWSEHVAAVAAAAAGGGSAASSGSSLPPVPSQPPTGNASSDASNVPRALNIGGGTGSSSGPRVVLPTATSVALNALGATLASEMQAQRQHEKEMASNCVQQ